MSTVWYDEKYFDPYQHEPEEIVIRHDHSQWIFFALLDLPQRERTFTIYRYNYPNGKKRSQGRTARHFYLSRVREKNLERTTRELFMKNYLQLMFRTKMQMLTKTHLVVVWAR